MKRLSDYFNKSKVRITVFIFVFLYPSLSRAVTLGGLEDTAGKMGYTSGNKDPLVTIGTIIKTALSLAGVIFLGLLIYAGYLWMLARGNDQEVEKAKTIIKNALIGLIIIMSAYAITTFVSQFVI